MTQEEKNLLLKDLCARLPYGVKVYDYDREEIREMGLGTLHDFMFNDLEVKPYLRSMSSMTEEEIAELIWLNEKCDAISTFKYVPVENYRIYDWMNRHYFDYRGLIDKGLALEAPEGMYK